MVKLNIIILLSSLLLIGCRKKEVQNNKALYVTSGYNKQKVFSKYAFQNGLIREVDSIIFDDSSKILDFDSRFPHIIIGEKIISSYGVPFDLNKKEIVFMDSLGLKILSRGLLLKSDSNCAYFYNFNNKNIVKYEISSNKILINENSKSFDLQFLNSFPCIDYISPDFKNVIKISVGDKKDFNKPCDVFIKNIDTDNDTKIVSSVYGTSMSRYSSTFPMPSIKWINNNEFIYTDLKRNDTITNCVIKKYNLLNKKSITLGEVGSIPLSTSNSTFQFDSKKNLFLNCKKGVFQVNYMNNKIEQTEIKYYLGNDYIISQDNKKNKILFKKKVIFNETDNEKLDITWNSFKSTNGYLAIITKRKIEGSTNFETLFKVWSENTEEWSEFKRNQFTAIVGWVPYSDKKH